MEWRNPHVWTARELKEHAISTEHPSGEWIPARPITSYGLRWWRNLKMAWGVLTGRYDALDWEEEALCLKPLQRKR